MKSSMNTSFKMTIPTKTAKSAVKAINTLFFHDVFKVNALSNNVKVSVSRLSSGRQGDDDQRDASGKL